jgi:alkanesulfonate monooxygenase SsuD/methylene tetrahydromethanopterin reductase-like flavin-dependent oxidoreductase (luciferase family)
LPKPVQQPLPIIIGGGGAKRTPALTAQYAAECNVGFASVDTFAMRKARVEAACAAIDRQRPMRYSVALVVCTGATEADIARRAAAIGLDPSELRENGAAGTADETAATIRRYADAGAERVYLQVLDLSDLDHVEFIASEVAPLLA